MDTGVDGGGAISLGSQVGQMLSGQAPSEPAPEAATSAAESGAPPTEPDAPAESASAEPTDTPAETEPSAEPAAEASAAEPVSKEPEVDPLAGATALTYTVDGESRTFDGIKVLGEDGAIVTPDAMPDLIRRLGERDHMMTTNRTLYEQNQTLEKLTEWSTKDASGKDVVLTGRAAAEAARVDVGTLKAALQTALSIFSKPPTEFVGQNEKGEIVWDPRGMEQLKLLAQVAERNASDAIRQEFASRFAVQPSTAPDIAALAPKIISAASTAAGVTAALSPDSVAILTDLLPNFVRPATPEDRRLNPALTIGEPVVDPKFQSLVAFHANQQKTVASTTQSAVDATKTNAAKLAAAARGQPKPKAPVAPAKPVPQPQQRVVDAGDAWDRMERAAAKAVAGAR